MRYHLGMYDESPKNKKGIHINAEHSMGLPVAFDIQMIINLTLTMFIENKKDSQRLDLVTSRYSNATYHQSDETFKSRADKNRANFY